MGTVSTLPTRRTADAAWARYSSLMQAALADPRLNADRAHVEERVRAHQAFIDAFKATEGADG